MNVPSVGRIVRYRPDHDQMVPGKGSVPIIWPAIISALHGHGVISLTAFPPAETAPQDQSGQPIPSVMTTLVPQADEISMVVDGEPPPAFSWHWPAQA